ncbi:MAG: hypothetical protein ACRD6X_09150 [Pyrinomonadaceae bacterium]
MSYKCIFKRIVPFILTFTAGLLIASIFVPITAPNFSGFRRGPSKYRMVERLRIEVNELRSEKYRLQDEIQRLQDEKRSLEVFEVQAPPPPPAVNYQRGSGTGIGK